MLFFFFKAEDGIRNIGVTGVQTCALPIYWLAGSSYLVSAQRTLAGGGDLIRGDSGQDTLTGGGGNDAIYGGADGDRLEGDRKSVVEGKSVDLGGCRIIKKNNSCFLNAHVH